MSVPCWQCHLCFHVVVLVAWQLCCSLLYEDSLFCFPVSRGWNIGLTSSFLYALCTACEWGSILWNLVCNIHDHRFVASCFNILKSETVNCIHSVCRAVHIVYLQCVVVVSRPQIIFMISQAFIETLETRVLEFMWNNIPKYAQNK